MKKRRMFAAILLSTALTVSSVLPAFAETEMYRSELTNEWIDASIKDQRPVAVMVDNESTALDHYGVNQADIVYEVMNSTINGRITRLMCVVKDWKKLTKIGNTRSSRTTNVFLAAEYNAILCHDGTASMMVDSLNRAYCDNLSGGFARYSNGKNLEFTEYITLDNYTNPNTGASYAGLINRINQAGYPTTYEEEWYYGPNFKFSDEEFELSTYSSVLDANKAVLPIPHNNSTLTYNPETKTYDYSEYGRPHIDALDQSVTTFKNAILQCCDFTDLQGKQGYLVFNLMNPKVNCGYYLTNGKAIPITWKKDAEYMPTKYYNAETGEELVLNTGKTYISITPDDSWNQLIIQ